MDDKRKNDKDDKNEKPKRRLRVKNDLIEYYNDEELAFYKKMSIDEQIHIAKMEKLISEMTNSDVPQRFKILQSDIDDKIKALAIQKLDQLNSLFPGCSEYQKINQYIQSLCKIPFGTYKALPVDKYNRDAIKTFIVDVQKTMDEKIYGHKDSKEQIIRLLAQWISNPKSKGLVLGIQGSMGTGKTTLIKDAICKALNLPFVFVPLGGISDGSFLTGHSYTYEGSTWGHIVDNLMKCGCMNPVFFFDELDKVSCTHHGDEIINILIHLTDATQNESFHDKYFSNLDFDLSRSLIIFSYNDESCIHPVLKDRMVRISTSGYTLSDKITICNEHMIVAILKEFSLSKKDIVFSDDVIKAIIDKVGKEEGVRNLRRGLHEIIGNINLARILDDLCLPVVVTEKCLGKYLKSPKNETNISVQMMYM